ncbi:hypothetical protein F2P81_014486 [Scophthalmus maximus]|uniref:Uncharacterized protein n=1 Tax=Scophthalmus maximus TaxID=52904 RepID=A0A6A4SAH0_SCOMX|nr:hypothetical protein F2P81_014486 [Scophthalmus maximus]
MTESLTADKPSGVRVTKRMNPFASLPCSTDKYTQTSVGPRYHCVCVDSTTTPVLTGCIEQHMLQHHRHRTAMYCDMKELYHVTPASRCGSTDEPMTELQTRCLYADPGLPACPDSSKSSVFK